MRNVVWFGRNERDYWRNRRWRIPAQPEQTIPMTMLHRSAYERLQRIEAAARQVDLAEFVIIDPAHRRFCHDYPELRSAIKHLRFVLNPVTDDHP